MNNYIKYATELMKFESITPKSSGAIEYIADLLKRHQFDVIAKEFGSDYIVSNMYAVYGKNEKKNLCFAGHVDVVPPGDLSLWKHNPFEPQLLNGVLYGRGAVDMKGAIACMLAATFDYLEKTPNPNFGISFLITSDEEGRGIYGTKEMIKYIHQLGHNLDFVILGEPTSEHNIGDTIKIGRRGSVNFDISVFGKQGHVAYPENFNNPIYDMLDLIQKLRKIKGLEITSLDTGNIATNVTPAKIKAKINVRFDTKSEDIIKSVVDTAQLYPNSKVSWEVTAESFMQNPNENTIKFAQIVKNLLQEKAEFSNSGGTSDSRFIKNYAQVLEFGLKNSTAHQIDEHVEIRDLQKLYSVYYAFLERY
jgi:succinyl-diaminopimelate desuccinylase